MKVVIKHKTSSSFFILYISILLSTLFSLSLATPTNDYHQEHFDNENKQLFDVFNILEKHFYSLSKFHKRKDNWKLIKLLLYKKINPKICTRYKIFYASKRIKEKIQSIHYSVVYCSERDNSCCVLEYEKLFQRNKMRINDRKYGIINKLVSKWLSNSHQKLSFIIDIMSYGKIMLNDSLYLIHVVTQAGLKHSVVVFEEDDNKINVIAQF